jgi:hypothetical protein
MTAAKAPATGGVPTASPVVSPVAFRAPRPNYTTELLLLAGVAVYILFYVYGRVVNARLVDSFMTTFQPLLAEQFARVGGSDGAGAGGEVTRESSNEFKLWASGRRNCLGMHIDFSLVGRQELFMFVARMFGGATFGTNADVATFEVPLEALVEPFILAVIPKRERKAVLEAFADVARFTKPVGAPAGLPDTLEVLAEARDASEQLLGNDFLAAVTACKRWFRALHVTDLAELSNL